jgi:hypothetical protein
LSKPAARQAAYHLFLNSAVAAPALDAVPAGRLDQLQGPVLAPEAGLLRLELAVLAEDQALARRLAAELRSAHADLGHRIDRVLKGRGPIANGRDAAVR